VTVTRENSFATFRAPWPEMPQTPEGKRRFSAILGQVAPLTGSIGAQVEEVGPDGATVVLAEHEVVSNHVRSIHAIRLANLAEITGALADPGRSNSPSGDNENSRTSGLLGVEPVIIAAGVLAWRRHRSRTGGNSPSIFTRA